MTRRGQTGVAVAASLALWCAWVLADGATMVDGVTVGLHEYDGPAQVSVEALAARKVAVRVRPEGEDRELGVVVELASSGSGTWPAEDVRVTNADGEPVAVRRAGTQWHRLLMLVPPETGKYIVEAVEPAMSPSYREAERSAVGVRTGIAAEVCRWFDGRDAALSLRFDDSHPTHLTTVLPLLRERGLRGTFMINPGGRDYLDHQAEWEACARADDQEFANHTLTHGGAATEEEIHRQVGEASKAIWGLFPHRSQLLALNRGGGTQWVTRRPFRYYLNRYHLFVKEGSLGMDDVYGGRVAAFRAHLEGHINRGLWCRAHFHSVGEGRASSVENIKETLDTVAEHRQRVWVAGMADIHKYATARDATRISLDDSSQDTVALIIQCGTDTVLYDHPLTIEVRNGDGWARGAPRVQDETGAPLNVREVAGPVGKAFRFDAPPVDGRYTIMWTP